MTESPAALVVLPKGPNRVAIGRVLAGLGLRVVSASDEFEAAARFAEARPTIVVASAARWRARDLAFLSSLRARSGGAVVVVLVPLERRAIAAPALEAGADAWLPEPVDLRELRALAARLLRSRSTGPEAEDGAALRAFAGEVGHAVNNPLQVLGLLLEQGPGADAPGWSARVAEEARRIRGAVEIVTAFGRLAAPRTSSSPHPSTSPVALGEVLEEGLAAGAAAGLWKRVGPAPREGVLARVDPDQARAAVDALLRCAAGRSERRPALLRGAVRRGADGGRPYAEAAVRARGVHVDEEGFRSLAKTVLFTDDRTRTAHPGLALPARVAAAHGGSLARRESAAGTVLSIRLPVAPQGTDL